MEFKYSTSSGEFEERPGVIKNASESVKFEDITPKEIAEELSRLERSGAYEKITVTANLKAPK